MSSHLGFQHWDSLHHNLVLFRLLLQLVDHFLFGHQGLLSLLELLLEILQLQSLDVGDRELTEPHPAQPWRPGRPRASHCSWEEDQKEPKTGHFARHGKGKGGRRGPLGSPGTTSPRLTFHPELYSPRPTLQRTGATRSTQASLTP